VLHQLAFTPAPDERCRVSGAALGQKSLHVWEEHVHNFVCKAKPVEVADKLCWIAQQAKEGAPPTPRRRPP
jgi:hypothetical protein